MSKNDITKIDDMTKSGMVFKLKELQKSQEPVAGESIDLRRKKKVLDVEPKWIFLLEQLKKAPAHISILSLLTSSEAHRNILLKVLNESHVTKNTNPRELEQSVEQVLPTNIITFTKDELIEYGIGHIKSPQQPWCVKWWLLQESCSLAFGPWMYALWLTCWVLTDPQ